MIERMPENSCLLCQVRKANQRGSHLTPNCLLKHAIGGREDYVAYSIDVENAEINKAVGRAAKSSETTVTPNPHVSDFVFCSICENFFGQLESEICPQLNEKIRDEKFSTQFRITTIQKDIVLKEALKINPNVFNLFIYSVVWRICLQQRFIHFESVINPKFEQRLATVLLNSVGKTIGEIETQVIELPYPYIIISSGNLDITSATYVNPNFEASNPELFYIGRYIVLIYHDFQNESSQVSTLPVEVLNKSFINRKSNEKIKILFIDEANWEKVNLAFVNQAARKYNNHKTT